MATNFGVCAKKRKTTLETCHHVIHDISISLSHTHCCLFVWMFMNGMSFMNTLFYFTCLLWPLFILQIHVLLNVTQSSSYNTINLFDANIVVVMLLRHCFAASHLQHHVVLSHISVLWHMLQKPWIVLQCFLCHMNWMYLLMMFAEWLKPHNSFICLPSDSNHNHGTHVAQRSPDDHQRIQSGEEGVAWQCTHTIQLQRCSSVESLLVWFGVGTILLIHTPAFCCLGKKSIWNQIQINIFWCQCCTWWRDKMSDICICRLFMWIPCVLWLSYIQLLTPNQHHSTFEIMNSCFQLWLCLMLWCLSMCALPSYDLYAFFPAATYLSTVMCFDVWRSLWEVWFWWSNSVIRSYHCSPFNIDLLTCWLLFHVNHLLRIVCSQFVPNGLWHAFSDEVFMHSSPTPFWCKFAILWMGFNGLCCRRRRPKPEVELKWSVWAVMLLQKTKRMAQRKDFYLAGRICQLNKKRKDLNGDVSLEGLIRRRHGHRQSLLDIAAEIDWQSIQWLLDSDNCNCWYWACSFLHVICMPCYYTSLSSP